MRDTVALLPADGWRAVYAIEGAPPSSDATTQLHVVPLVAFALIMEFSGDEPEEQLVGMVPEGNQVIPCVSPTFVGYLARDAQLSSLLPDLALWRQAQAEEEEAEKFAAEIRGEQLRSYSPKFSETGATGPN